MLQQVGLDVIKLNREQFAFLTVGNLKSGEYRKLTTKEGIIYEGTFANDNFDGIGKLYLKEGMYYDGDFKNGEKDGHGEIYDKDNNIILEGQFLKDQLNGSYKFFKEDEYLIGEYK